MLHDCSLLYFIDNKSIAAVDSTKDFDNNKTQNLK